ncbi:MAG TPA: MaoC family dehydratase N-terminal domain-containing protein [Pseudonocardiaceae bacterium]|nr:MaoC family dehydratase N-terminal domain-containing protein [Pseudonocardiaceae bacterium]
MALDPAFVGRSYPAADVYQVGREKIREFAEAIGDGNPVYRDPGAARTFGYPDVIAPPTFAIILALRAQQALISDPDLGLDYSRMVHGDQSFTHHRPIRAGDELATTLHVDGVRTMGGNDLLTVRCEITDGAGEPVTTARSMLVVRGPDGGPDERQDR